MKVAHAGKRETARSHQPPAWNQILTSPFGINGKDHPAETRGHVSGPRQRLPEGDGRCAWRIAGSGRQRGMVGSGDAGCNRTGPAQSAGRIFQRSRPCRRLNRRQAKRCHTEEAGHIRRPDVLVSQIRRCSLLPLSASSSAGPFLPDCKVLQGATLFQILSQRFRLLSLCMSLS